MVTNQAVDWLIACSKRKEKLISVMQVVTAQN
jgi:invasion protein IalB